MNPNRSVVKLFLPTSNNLSILIIIINSQIFVKMATVKLPEKKPFELKIKDGKLSCRERKRKSDCIPELVIDLQDERLGRNSLSNWSANYGSTVSMIAETQFEKDKENCGKQRAISFRNPSSLKTKHNENVREELEALRLENETLRGENMQLKYRISQLEETQRETISSQINALKIDLESSRTTTVIIEEKYVEMRLAYEEVCFKAKELFEKLLEEKKWQKSLTELVVGMDCESEFEGDTMSKTEDEFETDSRKEYYLNKQTSRDRSFCCSVIRKNRSYD